MSDQDFRKHLAAAMRRVQDAAGHPSFEDLVRYVVEPESRTQDETIHLAACEQCQAEVRRLEEAYAEFRNQRSGPIDEAEIERFRSIVRDQMRSARTPIRWWIPAAAALLCVVAGTLWYQRQPAVDRLIADAYRERRPFEYRIAAAMPAPLVAQRGEEGTLPPLLPLLRAQALVAEAIRKAPDDGHLLRQQAQLDVFAMRPDSAIRALERARGSTGADAALLADLGLAYAVRGDRLKSTLDYEAALDHLSNAIRMQPRLLEARFNRALVLEKLLLLDQAEAEWQSYLQLDPKGPWAEEARSHQAALRKRVEAWQGRLRKLAATPGAFLRGLASGEILDAEAHLPVALTQWPQSGLESQLSEAMHELARLLARKHEDRWLADWWQARPGSESIQALREAVALNQKGSGASALPVAEHALRLFLQQNNRPGMLRAGFERVYALHLYPKPAECRDAARDLRARLRGSGYRWLEGQTLVEVAVCEMRLGHLGAAAQSLREAEQISEQARLDDLALRVRTMQLDTLSHIGPPRVTADVARSALERFWAGAFPGQRAYAALVRLRDDAALRNHNYAAYHFGKSALWAIASTQYRVQEAAARARQAVLAQQSGLAEEASTLLDQSRRMMAELCREVSEYCFDQELSATRLLLERDDLDQAARQIEGMSQRQPADLTSLGRLRYLLTLGEVYRRRNLATESAAAFREAILIGRKRLAALARERDQSGELRYLEQAHRGLSEALVKQGDSAQALRQWKMRRDSHSPRNTAALHTCEVSDSFVVWLEIEDTPLPHVSVPKAALISAAERFAVRASDPSLADPGPDGRLLYDWLVAPFEKHLARMSEITLDLDGVLASVPMAALVNSGGLYFGSRIKLRIATGGASRRDSVLDRESRALVVTDPELSDEARTLFAPIPSARLETEALRAAFPVGPTLQGSYATSKAVREAVPGAALVHFAGHGYSSGGVSALVLSSENRSSAPYDLLRGVEIGDLDWSQCRLVVLSACATAAAEATGANNPESMVRALRRGGVPEVVASLWAVDSDATNSLFRYFYEAIAGGATPAAALQDAQRQVRGTPRWSHPYYWAGFQIYGEVGG